MMNHANVATVVALKAFAEMRAAKMDVKRFASFVTVMLGVVIFLTDASFFFTAFSPMFMDENGNYTQVGLISNVLKALVSIGMIVTLGYAFEELHTKVHGSVWDNKTASLGSNHRLYTWLLQTYIFGTALVSLYLLYIVGLVTFGIAESQYAFASLDISFDAGVNTADDAPSLVTNIRKLAPIFVVTATGVAICIAELKRHREQKKYVVYMREVAKRCEAYIQRHADLDALKSGMDTIASKTFLYETTARSHADFHDVTLATLHRVKGIIMKASEACHLSDDDLSVGQKYLDDGLVLPQRQALLERVSEAEQKLAALVFFLPRVSQVKGEVSPSEATSLQYNMEV